MGATTRRLRRARLLPVIACLVLAVLALYALGARSLATAASAELAPAGPPAPVRDAPHSGTAKTVARGQAFFYTFPESNRLGSFETWRPKELLSRARLEPPPPADDNIFVAVQSSARTVWRNLPALRASVLRDFPHAAVYSSAADAVRGTEVLDAIALLDAEFVASSPHLEPYRVMRVVRDSHVNVALDEVPVVGAGALARFVTLPMLQHAYAQHAEHDWYVAILDSTYVFSANLRAVLAALDPSEPLYLGSAVQGPQQLFADLGSAVVLSREAARRAFGSYGSKSSESSESSAVRARIAQYAERAAAEARGDYVLALYLKEQAGLELDVARSGGHFQGNPVHGVPASAKNWCTRIVSVNTAHPHELDMLAEYAQLKSAQPVLYSDVYFDFMKPYLPADAQQNWDNGAADAEFDAAARADSADGADSDAPPHRSLADCRSACARHAQCLMLRYDAYAQRCGLALSTVSLGAPIIRYDSRPHAGLCAEHGVQCGARGADTPTTSEWLIDRVRAMRRSLACDPLHGDASSEGTEFGSLDQVEGWWHRARRLAPDADADASAARGPAARPE